MTMPLDWTHLTAEVAGRSVSETRHATADELVELARTLDIPSFESLAVNYEIKPLPRGRFRFSGEIKASLTQACIVTLDPVPAELTESFSVELLPEEELEVDNSEAEQEILSTPDLEPIADGRIEAGAIIYELISAALEPYPRKEGAEFDWIDPKAAEAASDNPFAVLKKLKAEK
jgi:uncharacterized metal-binding protein YceD (DUF177 family)